MKNIYVFLLIGLLFQVHRGISQGSDYYAYDKGDKVKVTYKKIARGAGNKNQFGKNPEYARYVYWGEILRRVDGGYQFQANYSQVFFETSSDQVSSESEVKKNQIKPNRRVFKIDKEYSIEKWFGVDPRI